MDALQGADASAAEERRNAEGRLEQKEGGAEGKDCRGDRSTNLVTHNGCDKKNPIRRVQKVL